MHTIRGPLLGSEQEIPLWYTIGGGAYAAWQARFAADASAANIDLTGNGNNLVFPSGNPAWVQATGWTSQATSSQMTLLASDKSITAAWRGKLAVSATTAGWIWWPLGATAGSAITGLQAQPYTDGHFYAGAGPEGLRLNVATTFGVDTTYILQHDIDTHNQRLYIGGNLVAQNTGAAFTENNVAFGTCLGGECVAGGLWRGTVENVKLLHFAMMHLPE